MGKEVNPPKDHHYVPQFYLRGFGIADKDPKKPASFWVHSAGKKTRASSTKNEAFEKELHTIHAAGEEPDRSLEHDLVNIEGIHASILKKILEHRGGQTLSHHEKREFAGFVGLQIARTPTHFKIVREFAKAFNEGLKKKIQGDSSHLEKLAAHFPGAKDLPYFDVETAKKWLNDKKLQSHIHLMGIGSLATKYGNIIFEEMAWLFPIASSGKKYCTSDDPVIVISKEGNRFHEGLGHDVQIIFPLSSDVCFFADRNMRVSPPTIEDVNEKVVWQARKFIYSQEDNPGIQKYLLERETIEKDYPREDVLKVLIEKNTKRLK